MNETLNTAVHFSGERAVLSYTDRFMSFGSCFATHLDKRFQQYKCHSSANPLGILFNPASIARCIDILTGKQPCDRNRESHGLYVNCDAHGDFCADSDQALQEIMDRAITQGRANWLESQHVIITLGTALVYESVETGAVLANCHRLPASSYVQRQLSPDEIHALLASHIEANPQKQFYMSVSPIRHIRDGLAENSRSKAALLLALQTLENSYNNVRYLPSYEILIDDLRDYRFYDRDMCHPNELAIDIIWQRFREHMFDARSQKYFAELSTIIQASEHRPRNPKSDNHRQFCAQQLQRIEKCEQEYGERDFSIEKEIFEPRIP